MSMHLKRQTSMRLSDEAHALLETLADKYGGKQRAIEAALQALDSRGKLTKAELLAELDRRLK